MVFSSAARATAMTVLLPLGFLAALASTIYTYGSVRDEAVRAFSREQQLSAELLAGGATRALQAHALALRGIDVARMPADESDWLEAETVRVGLPDGSVLRLLHQDAPVGADEHPHPVASASPCARCALAGTLVYTSAAHPDGRYLALLVPTANLASMLRRAGGWMVDTAGRIVGHHDLAQIGNQPFDAQNDDPALTDMLRRMADGQRGTATYWWQPNGQPAEQRLAAYAPVDGTPGFSVAVSHDQASAIGAVRRALGHLKRAGALLLVGFVLGLATVVHLVRRSARQQAERTRERLELADVAAHTERLAQLGALTAGVSHDLRGPIGAIRLGLEELDEDHVGDPTLRRDMRRAVDMMQHITSDLTKFSRADHDDAPAAELAATLRSTVRMLGPVKAARCEVVVDDDAVWVTMSGPRLGQVLLNLMSNAFGAGERVRLVAEIGPDEVRVIVEDDGPGIAAEHAERVFEPFFTTKPEGEGTGLGLPLCRRFAEEAGGRLTLGTSSIGGAALVLTLPRTSCRETPELPRCVA